MTTPITRKVKDLTLLGDLQAGDVVVGERTTGTTVRLTYTGSSGGGDVDSVNGQTGAVVLDADDISDVSTTNKFTSAADELRLATTSGTNTGDQTSIVGVTGTKAQFDTAVTDGNILYVGDVTQYTDELAQDAIGAMVDSSLTYVDATPLLQRAALTGDVTAAAGSNATTIAAGAVTLAKQANMATASVVYRKTAGAGAPEVQTLATLKTDLGLTGTNSGDQTTIVGITGTKAQFDTTCSDGDFVYQSSALGTPVSGNISNCTGYVPILDSASLTKSGTQTVTTSTEAIVTWDTETWDNNSLHEGVTNPGRITAASAGLYLVRANIEWASNDIGNRLTYLYINGSIIYTERIPASLIIGIDNCGYTLVRSLAANDYLEVRVFQTSGGDLTVTTSNSFFTVAKLGKLS